MAGGCVADPGSLFHHLAVRASDFAVWALLEAAGSRTNEY